MIAHKTEKIRQDESFKTHSFNLSPKENGGEALYLTTYFMWNGDDKDGVYTNQELTLSSYGNSASLNLYGIRITPEILRKLANELESKTIEANKMIEEQVKKQNSTIEIGRGRSSRESHNNPLFDPHFGAVDHVW